MDGTKMNREIKFRTWDAKNNKFLKFIPPEEYMLDSEEWHHSGDEDVLIYPSNPLPNFKGRLIHQQYTGLKDKKEKEIYEGDILDLVSNTRAFWGQSILDLELVSFDTSAIGVVVFEEGQFIIDGSHVNDSWLHRSNWRNSEVIGNIFENKERLWTGPK